MNEALNKEFLDVILKTKKLLIEEELEDSKSNLMTTLQFRGLMFITDNPGHTVGEISDKLKMSSGAIAQFLKRLELSGLIEKRTDDKDARSSRIYLSSKGEEQLQDKKRFIFEKISKFLSPIEEKDLKELIRIHKILLENLENS